MIPSTLCPVCEAKNCRYNPTCIECNHELPGPELRLNNKLADVWNDFAVLPPLHPSDAREFEMHIHALQNIVAARTCVKMKLVGMVRKQ